MGGEPKCEWMGGRESNGEGGMILERATQRKRSVSVRTRRKPKLYQSLKDLGNIEMQFCERPREPNMKGSESPRETYAARRGKTYLVIMVQLFDLRNEIGLL